MTAPHQERRIIPSEHFDEFYNSLVGDEVATKAWREQLADTVCAFNPAIHEDPYDALEVGLKISYMRAAGNTLHRSVSQDAALRADLYTASILGAAYVTMRGLEALGEVYVDRAPGPQQRKSVEQSINSTLRYVYSFAFAGRDVSAPALEAAYLGVDPSSRLMRPVIRWSKKLHNPDIIRAFSPRGFKVTEHDNGQLHVQPKYKRPPKARDIRCPGTFSRVENGARSEPALYKVLQTIGAVTMDEIYPQYFDIES